MDFGRLTNLDGVDFALAELDAGGRVAEPAVPIVRVGAPAWAKKTWVGRVYPSGTHASALLDAYANAYSAVELNATFYRTPSEDEARAWASRCPEGFRFAPKLPKTLSQAKALVAPPGERERFEAFLRGFGERLGPSLLSLPPSFSSRDLPRLVAFFDAWPGDLPLAVELRHESWFSSRALVPAARDAFTARNVTTVITDVAGRRDVSHATITSSTVFVRFVGNALHPTDRSRIDAWSTRLSQLAKRGVRDIYFFVHEPDDETTPDLLSYAADRFEASLGVSVRAPRLDEPKGQLALF